MSDTTHTAHASSEPKRLSAGTYVAAFIILFLILVVFADLFVLILGTIGLIVTFAAFYADSASHDTSH
ncbi:hypothetical protein [Dyadobacter psychrotolerans]|uniref:Uncharacterized protein n=1 Tax=Dyadobacter psychrotolerans TaxID=2541721 RepID=A0A4R5DXF3_9BACT|nr:hypothetical protein [Dyadobacter psychrotolerans]TDE18607.1 hypothetical protein E0F88_03450 [Dyadobacter psychrotolerans]